MIDFCHLHSHTQFSLLDGASDIGLLMKKAKNDGQSAVAITDHGNMFGVFKFVNEAKKNGIKPIIGCEFYITDDRFIKTFEKSQGRKDNRFHQLMLAKNTTGYQNLIKMCTLGFTEGLYGKYPRIDKTLIEKYHEGIIATSCCLGAEIPQAILKHGEKVAEEKLRWWIDVFGEDYYIELQRHSGLSNIDGTGISQEKINQVLLGFAAKYNIKTIATNDAHYVEQEDSKPHDVLLCVNTGNYIAEEKRFKFPSDDFYFKTKDEMHTIFSDVPEALANTMEIADKVDVLSLTREILLPAFPLPAGFTEQGDYLRHLAFEGARKKYDPFTPEVEERLNFELKVILDSGYPGYFLIVQDFTSVARQMGVSVGPGRGSAAGSLVAYVLGITNIDPIKFDLLFERFLNPERVSMPDIDIDFDDEGRSKVIDYVIDKYGKNQVAQIITYGTMAAKSALKDVGRVMQIPLSEVEAITKNFPGIASASLKKILGGSQINKELLAEMTSEDKEKANKLKELSLEDTQIGEMIRTATKLEGSVRNTGIHACGVIITPEDITNYIPVTTAKDSDLLVSQFDNDAMESAGLLKMDFLGLKTLTIIKDAVEIVRERYDKVIDIDDIPFDDPVTLELFQKGETVGIFQYESLGMQKYLKELKPTRLEDLIAMNALYRPGPLQYIPDFIARKNGKQEITFDLPDMESYLAETYGITVYQEQVMLLSQKLAGFSKGDADVLRKAMGKKQKATLDKMLPKFIEGCVKNGHPEDIVKKVWTDWEAFASYAFNKSHSTCYAYLAFQTGYLKANYPAAFMASVLNHNKSDITKVNFYLRECKRMDIEVLGPDVNESNIKFTVTSRGHIRFGLSALKGVGEGPVEEIVRERKENGHFTDIYEVVRRLNLRAVNKKCLDSLALSGAFDSFNSYNRAQFFTIAEERTDTFIEQLLRYGANYQAQKDSNQMSLFGDAMTSYIDTPKPPKVDEWNLIEKLEREKEVAGIYISGHPLDDYHLELENFVNCQLSLAENNPGKALRMGGIVTETFFGTNNKGNGYAKFTIQDYNGSLQLSINNENFESYKHLVNKGQVLFVEGSYEKGYNSDRLFFKTKKISMLDTIGKLLTKSITVKIDLDNFEEQTLEELTLFCTEHPGPHNLKIRFVETDDHVGITLLSKQVKINADFNFVRLLNEHNLAYRIN